MPQPIITPRHPTAAAIERLTELLHLPPGGQDWEVEVADAGRVDEFLDAYENWALDDDERFALMALVVASLDDLLNGDGLAKYLPWQRVRRHLWDGFDLHAHTVRCWCLLEQGDPAGGFAVTPLMREVWNTRLRFPAGPPGPRAFGFLSLGLTGGGDFTNAPDAVAAVAAALDRPAQFTDADGFADEVTAGAVGPDGRVAWVQCRSREHGGGGYVEIEYRLRARAADGRGVLDWEVETYNPYFGCDVGYLAWHGDRVVVVYREKHHTYAASVPTAGAVTRVRIGHEWMPAGDQITHRDWERPAVVLRLAVPHLGPLEPITVGAARAAGLLPHNFDVMADAARR